MKKIFLSMVMMISATFVFAQKSLAVATFDISNNAVTKDEVEAITELYITELVATGKLNIIDRVNFDKILKEMNFQNSDWSDSEKTTELGKIINVEYIARGQIIKLGSKMYLSATIIDVKTANIITSSRKQFDSIDDIFELLSDFSDQLVKNIQNEAIGKIGQGGGVIFNVEGNRYFECSSILGQTTWNEAKSLCESYCGGDFNDWYLPSVEELKCIYQNLKTKKLLQSDEEYWSSAQSKQYYSYVFDFHTGTTNSRCKEKHEEFNSYSWSYFDVFPSYCCVRAVRSYIVEE